MIQLIALDRIPVPAAGDLDLSVLWLDAEPAPEEWQGHPAAGAAEGVEWHPGEGRGLLVFSSRGDLPDPEGLSQRLGAKRMRVLKAVLPVLSRRNLSVPFHTCAEMRDSPAYSDSTLADLAIAYESERGGDAPAAVLERMGGLSDIMRAAIRAGLRGTHYEDRILPSQSPGFTRAEDDGRLIHAGVNNLIIRYVSAIMEVKSSMGVIVAAPTAGSCGAMPGAVLAVADTLGSSEEETRRALLIAGLIGVFIARDATFAAEEGGCMAECGSGSAMAAAAMVYLAGGDNDTQLAAASMALQNNLGMICDPVANRVEAPCLGRNVMAATNALACANMALGGYDHLVSLDEVIQAMNGVAKAMPREHRCTALGGLSISPTSKRIAGQLAAKGCAGCGPKTKPATPSPSSVMS